MWEFFFFRYFVRTYPKAASHILSHSHHPQHGYSFAIVGINITHMAYRLLAGGQAKSHMYNVTTRTSTEISSTAAVEPATLDNFHHFYCYLFIEFDRYKQHSSASKCKNKLLGDF